MSSVICKLVTQVTQQYYQHHLSCIEGSKISNKSIFKLRIQNQEEKKTLKTSLGIVPRPQLKNVSA